ncbi:MAG: DnaA/Hda family protein, partial [Planctomycetota bacterium]
GLSLQRLAGAIERRVGRQRYSVWFAKSTKMRLGHDGLHIAVPNDFISDWITRHFKQAVSEAVVEVLNCSLPVKYDVVPRFFEDGGAAGDGELFTPPPMPNGGPSNAPSGNSQVLAQASAPIARTNIDPLPRGIGAAVGPEFAPREQPRLRHGLDEFIVGPSNELAFNCCQHVAEKPGKRYNPLFIHGGVGLGKTHLLQALCREYATKHPTGRWAYMTGEEFTNSFLQAIRTNKVDAFRRRMRDLDLLVIDDVHFLGGKKATQEEFLHTFNAVEAMGNQVVMASDAHPRTIASFGESLINRFVSGMVVRIESPNKIMRERILQALARRHDIALPEDVADWIATRVTQNVRELEGAVTRLAAHVRLGQRELNIRLAADVLSDFDRQSQQPIRPEQV